MSTPSTSGRGSSKRSRSVEDDESQKPKRPCSAFCYYMQAHKATFTGFNSDAMKQLREQWNQLDDRAKAPYEARAANDANRYRREKEAYERSRVKKPCNAYAIFIKDFMMNKAQDFPSAQAALSAGAAEWKNMSMVQKAPWKNLEKESARRYSEQKMLKEASTVRYVLTDAGLAAAAKLKKKAVANSVASAKAKAKSMSKVPLKTALKTSTKSGAAAKKVTFSGVKKSTKNVKNRKTK